MSKQGLTRYWNSDRMEAQPDGEWYDKDEADARIAELENSLTVKTAVEAMLDAKVAKLEAERDNWKQMAEWQGAATDALHQDEAVALRAENKGLRMDAERLSFLHAHLSNLGEVDYTGADGCRCGGCWVFELSGGDLTSDVQRESLTEAIDAARGGA